MGIYFLRRLGLNAIAISIASEISNIIVIDVDNTKLDAAIEMGAANTLKSNSSDALAELLSLTEGSLVAVIDTFGGADTGQLAVRALVKGGQYLVVGQAGGDFKMPRVWLPQKAITVHGSHVGNSAQLLKLIDMVRDGKIKQMPIDRRPLSKINEAIEDLAAGRVTGRVVFQPD